MEDDFDEPNIMMWALLGMILLGIVFFILKTQGV